MKKFRFEKFNQFAILKNSATNSSSDKIRTGDLPSVPTSSIHCIFLEKQVAVEFQKSYRIIPHEFLKDSSNILQRFFKNSTSILIHQNVKK